MFLHLKSFPLVLGALWKKNVSGGCGEGVGERREKEN